MIPRQKSPFARARFFASIENTPCEYASPGDPKSRSLMICAVANAVLSGVGRLQYRHDGCAIQVTLPDAFEMRADTAQLRSHKAVHEMQTPVQPGEQFVFDVVMDRKRDLSALGPNLSEIDDAHHGNVPAHGLERILFG